MGDTTLRPARRRRRGGFTLVEILTSLVILAVGIVATVTMLGQAGVSQRRARNEMLCSAAAQDMLGAMEAADFGDIDPGDGRFTGAALEEALTEAGVPRPDATVTIAPYPAADTAHLKRVTITIEYGDPTSGAGHSGDVGFETLLMDDVGNMT
jgi:prepilin-type N-terminal cleavage/methylation domain-containing protein